MYRVQRVFQVLPDVVRPLLDREGPSKFVEQQPPQLQEVVPPEGQLPELLQHRPHLKEVDWQVLRVSSDDPELHKDRLGLVVVVVMVSLPVLLVTLVPVKPRLPVVVLVVRLVPPLRPLLDPVRDQVRDRVPQV